MTSSGTYAFSPANADVTLNAFGRIQIRRPSITTDHLQDAYTEANLLMTEWTNKQPNLWTSELQSYPLTQGVATYALPARTIMVIANYIDTGTGQNTTSRLIGPISTYEYASMPNKEMQALPTSFWLDRQITPSVVLWPVPDGGGPYTMKLRVVRQIQDVGLTSGQTPDLPNRWLDAFTAGLSHRLARIYAPDQEAKRKADAMESWQTAATQDTENVNTYLIPGISGYYN